MAYDFSKIPSTLQRKKKTFMNLSVCKRLIKLESKYPMEIYDSQREKEIDEGEVVKGMVEMVFRS